MVVMSARFPASISFALAGTALLAPSASLAWSSVTTKDVCGFAEIFDVAGNTTVTIGQQRHRRETGFITVSIENENWSIKAGDKFNDEIRFEFGKFAFGGQPATADRMLVLLVRGAYLTEFAAAQPTFVTVYKGKEVIGRLNFTGFWTEYVKFQSCRLQWEREGTSRQKLENIERNFPLNPSG
jgi:hypothetical protein